MLTGNQYETRAALISVVHRFLSSRSTLWFAEGKKNLPQRWQKFIDIHGITLKKKNKKEKKILNVFLERAYLLNKRYAEKRGVFGGGGGGCTFVSIYAVTLDYRRLMLHLCITVSLDESQETVCLC